MIDARLGARLTSRKFLLAAATLASAHWLVAAGHIADGVYSAVVIAVVAAYVTGNVAERAVGGSRTAGNRE